eukprot:TRINITY_DN54051_c0_g1_i1.p1 TRINITY_DN54051_c0_g1~~TRINITY_DN54051_c0_g1_i1.p1  ORF type:complete len:459 (+),score=108.37 TRINITY_DN54051_c0_g1_i1:241-1617(+)
MDVGDGDGKRPLLEDEEETEASQRRAEGFASGWRQQMRRSGAAATASEHYALLEEEREAAEEERGERASEARLPLPVVQLPSRPEAQSLENNERCDKEDAPLAAIARVPPIAATASDVDGRSDVRGGSRSEEARSSSCSTTATCARSAPSGSAAAAASTATPLSGIQPQSVAAAAMATAASATSFVSATIARMSQTASAASSAAVPTSAGEVEMKDVPNAAAEASKQQQAEQDRTCFICLMEEDKEDDNLLIPCCTTCYACVHKRCWREWRNNQRVTALRSRLLGTRMQTNNLLRCSICKSGTAMVAGEEGGLDWINELLGGGEARGQDARTLTLASLARRANESGDDREPHLEDFLDGRTCGAMAVYLAVLLVVLVAGCSLIAMQRFYAGDVVLCCIIALYELSVLQLVILAITRRRAARLAASAAAAGNAAVNAAISSMTRGPEDSVDTAAAPTEP